jgi:hypothetical protein
MFRNEITFTETQLNKIEWKYLLRMTKWSQAFTISLVERLWSWKISNLFLDQITRKYVNGTKNMNLFTMKMYKITKWNLRKTNIMKIYIQIICKTENMRVQRNFFAMINVTWRFLYSAHMVESVGTLMVNTARSRRLFRWPNHQTLMMRSL